MLYIILTIKQANKHISSSVYGKVLEALINPLAKSTQSSKTVVLKYWKEAELFGEIADSKSREGNG